MSQFDEVRTTSVVVRAVARQHCWLALVLIALTGSVAAQTVTKTAPSAVDAGESVSYSIEIENTTGASISSVSIVDTLPGLISYTSGSGASRSCSEASGTVTCNLSGALAAGASTTVTIQGVAGAPVVDTVTTNSVSLRVSGTEEDTDSANTTVRAVADLTLDKSIVDGASRVNALTLRGGDAIAFAVSVSNSGPSAARNLRIRDTLPAGFGFSSGSGTGWSCSASSNVVTCDYTPDLASGATAPELLINATAPAVAGTFSNQASGESDADDTAFPFASDSVSITVFLEADLRVAKQAASATGFSGQPISYTYTLTNFGPHPATNISLVDVFDRASLPGTPNVTSGGANWTCAWSGAPAAGESQLECDYNAALSLAGNGTSQLVLTVEITGPSVDDPITLNNQATVNSSENLPSPANNVSASVAVQVLPSADLSVTPRPDPAAGQDADSNFVYNVAVANAGPSIAREVVVTDRVPEGALLQAAFGMGWTCEINQVTGTYRCSRPNLASGSSGILSVATRLPRNPPMAGTASGDISSGTASVSSDTHDPDTSNNSDAPFSVTVAAVWSLAIDKSASQPVVVPGQSFTYEIAIDNFGPSDLSGDIEAFLSDDFDANLRGGLEVCGVTASVPCWQCESSDQPFLLNLLDTDNAALTGIGGGNARSWSARIGSSSMLPVNSTMPLRLLSDRSLEMQGSVS